MAGTGAIPSALHPAVLEQAARGVATEHIAAWLLSEHQVQCTGRAVRRFLAKTRTERAEVTKQVLTEELGKVVVKDLGAVDRLLADAKAVQDAAWAPSQTLGVEVPRDGELALKAMEQQRKLLELRFKLAGAGEEGGASAPARVVLLPAEED